MADLNGCDVTLHGGLSSESGLWPGLALCASCVALFPVCVPSVALCECFLGASCIALCASHVALCLSCVALSLFPVLHCLCFLCCTVCVFCLCFLCCTVCVSCVALSVFCPCFLCCTVCISRISVCVLCVQKLAKLVEEEKLREEAGFYDFSSEDEAEKELEAQLAKYVPVSYTHLTLPTSSYV